MSSAENKTPEFGKIRAALWPIHDYEMKKFLPMCLMMFSILFVYTVLRVSKDSVIIPAAGSAVVPFIKGLVVMPVAIIFVIIYTKLVNLFKAETVFYMVSGVFISFFALYGFVIFPNSEFILPNPESVVALKESYPRLQHLFSIYAGWTDVIYFTFAELWGSVMLSLLFWQFANEITKTKEATRFYALFGLLANFAPMAASAVLKYSSSLRGEGESVADFIVPLQFTTMTVIAFAGLVVFFYHWMQRNVLTDIRFYDAAEKAEGASKKSKKPKLSVGESLKLIASSKYLGYIALLILAYGISINLIEVNWKEIVKNVYPGRAAYQEYMGGVQLWTGLVTIVAILLFKSVVRSFGWFIGAIITPIMIAVTGGIFFIFVIFEESMSPLATLWGTTSLLLAVTMGTIQGLLSKGTKYALFDPTKEMAYIPLDPELKSKGKAAVDVIGGRLGKAGGGYISMALLMLTAAPDTLSVMPYIAVIVGIVILLWIVAVAGLNKLYQIAVRQEK
ncbi:MAG: NTP/NDP exchange transporter [Alphaproteobacteria bacterium]|nr:NTP/NDP exchange transporter [Alphaproteobacteria bacterium]